MFSYPPSDKPKTPVFRVSLLSDSETNPQIKQAIKASLQQFIDREGAKFNVAYYNESVQKDKYRNFSLAAEAETIIKQPLDKNTIDLYVDTIHELLEDEASKLADELIEIEMTYDKDTFDHLHRYLTRSMSSKFVDLAKHNHGKFSNRSGEDRTYSVAKDMILPFIDLYVKNHYLNSYHLHQVIAGDYAAYKGSSSEIVKRMAGIFGPGIRGLVDSRIGMKEKFKVLVLQDTKIPVEHTEERLKYLIYGDAILTESEQNEFNDLMKLFSSYDISDAQGFMVPSRFKDLEKGFGRSWGLGNVMKPVHFELLPKTLVEVLGLKEITEPVS